MNKDTRDLIMETLKRRTLKPEDYKTETGTNFQIWLQQLYPNAEDLKGVVIGCAIFRREQQSIKMFAETEIEKDLAQFRIEISQIYIDLAKDYLSCV